MASTPPGQPGSGTHGFSMATDRSARPSARQRALASTELRRQAIAAASPAHHVPPAPAAQRLAEAQSEIDHLLNQLRRASLMPTPPTNGGGGGGGGGGGSEPSQSLECRSEHQ